jgi:hypothetical protein
MRNNYFRVRGPIAAVTPSGRLGLKTTSARAGSWAAFASIALGCTTIAGLDKDYVPTQGGSDAGNFGGAGSAGEAGAGGTLGDGATGSSGCADNSQCPGQKCCAIAVNPPASICVDRSPFSGCSLSDDCTPCPAPPENAVAVCAGEQCSVQCKPGFSQLDGQCVADGSGGSSGTAGTGGLPACDPATCPTCNSDLAFLPCCRGSHGTCGCSPFPAAFCL